MAIALALLASLSIGTGEFWAGRTVRQLRSEELTSAFFLFGIVFSVAMLPFFDGEPVARDLWLGAASGAFNGVGLAFLYKAYSEGTLGLAAPIAGMLLAAIPAIVDIGIGESTASTLTAVGIVIGIVSIGLTAFRRGSGAASWGAIRLAVMAGCLYGVALTLLGRTTAASGVWPLVPQRAVGFVVAVLIALATGPRFLPPRNLLRRPFVVGVLGSLGIMLYTAASQRGQIGAVAVAGTQFTAVAVSLAYIFDRERLAWWQTIGVVGTALGVSFIALG
jgi:drug/metabolite transporter (DMT)-like permease